MTSPADLYDMPEFIEYLETIKRAADIRITLEANKEWLAERMKEMKTSE